MFSLRKSASINLKLLSYEENQSILFQSKAFNKISENSSIHFHSINE